MGLTQKLGTVPLAIFTDASNNVGIGGAPSGSYKFDVTGTGRFTGALTALQSNLSSGASSYGTWNGTTSGAGFLALQYNGSTYGWIGQGSAIVTSGSNTDMAISYNNNLVFSQGAGAAKMTLTSAGNVGIGTASPSVGLHVSNSSNSTTAIFENPSGTTEFIGLKSTSGTVYLGNVQANMYFEAGGSERMRITSGGCVYVGTTSVPSGATDANAGSMYVADNVYVGNSSGTAGYACKIDGYNNSLYVIWQNTTGGTAGGVALSYGATSWSPVSSDERTKKNFETTQGLEEILQIEPVKYHLLSDEDDSVKRLGFKAQNIQPLIPEMVHKTGRQLEDGSEILTITPDYLLPVLVKAIQELEQRIQTLENK